MNNTATSLSTKENFEEALKDCDTTKIKKLISSGFYVNQILADLSPLSLALNKGRFEVVELLISSGADVCQLDTSGKFCPMYYAIKNKCPQKIIRRLILAGFPINGTVEYNFRSTALHLAVYANQKSVIKCLFSLSANVDCRDANGLTPLHVAVQANHPKIVKMLALKGAKVDAECCDKFTPMMMAIHDNNSDLVELLITLGSDVNYEPEKPKYSYQKALNYAAGLGHVEIMQLLLNHTADAKSSTKSGDSPLHSMAHSDKLTDKSVVQDTIQIIIERGGDLNCYNNVGHNPLHSSIISKNTMVAKSLLEAGSDVKTPTKNEDTPLHLAAVVGDPVMVKLLLNNGADMTAKSSCGLTPYDLALKRTDADIVRMFWSHGQPFDETVLRFESNGEINENLLKLIDEQKQFLHAVEFGSYSKMVNALENGAEPRGCSLLLKHPLHFSASQHNEKIVHELLERGVPVGILDANGETALHVASKSGNVAACVDLLSHGACYNGLARCRKTPYQMAKDNKHKNVMQLFKGIKLLFHSIHKKKLYETTIMLKSTLWRVDNSKSLYHPLKVVLNCVNSEGHTLLSKATSIGFIEGAETIMSYRLNYLKVSY